MRYLVSYIVYRDGFRYRQHFLSFSDDFPKVLREIVGRKGLLKNYLKDYERNKYVYVDSDKPLHKRSILRITITELPEEHAKVLSEYLWIPSILG